MADATRVHIRGNTGTQILQAAAALAELPIDAEPIICVNHGRLAYDGTSKLDLFFDLKCRILNVDMQNKTPYWKPGVAKSIFENRDKIFQWLKPKEEIYPTPGVFHISPALHIRGGDKKIASEESYRALFNNLIDTYQKSGLNVYTDDQSFAKSIVGDHKISQADWYQDWLDIFHSPVVHAAPSAYIMSMLLFDPTKELHLLGESRCDGGYDITNDFIFLKEALPFCPNVRIID